MSRITYHQAIPARGKFAYALDLPGKRGRVWGYKPGFFGHSKPEDPARDELAIQVDGLVEVGLFFGRADVMTPLHVWEVEPVKSWRHGAHQALSYAMQSGLRPNLAIFGPTSKDLRLRMFEELSRIQPKVTLWLRGHEWHTITSASAARSEP